MDHCKIRQESFRLTFIYLSVHGKKKRCMNNILINNFAKVFEMHTKVSTKWQKRGKTRRHALKCSGRAMCLAPPLRGTLRLLADGCCV